ncbi:hypothetical protein TL16_g02879 [Triparma laevis f. inornata]|uniref:F-ATPase gamma subunit n=1 Tax=Triparma laevis f. inornata TaxID=1714386 RepID=A0A9W6ZYY2_9STRA|nr:hypothetical protein TL16_g02879 [Triparma laevis f. inornata]
MSLPTPAAIRDRITTVKNTKKITMAMKLVAAAKVRKAQDAVLQTRPFSETLQSVFGGLINRLGVEAADLPLLQEREVKKVTLVVISGDRGLCGSYNSYMIKKAQKRCVRRKSEAMSSTKALYSSSPRYSTSHQEFQILTLARRSPLAAPLTSRYDELVSKGIDVEMVMVGKKANVYFQRREFPIKEVRNCEERSDEL